MQICKVSPIAAFILLSIRAADSCTVPKDLLFQMNVPTIRLTNDVYEPAIRFSSSLSEKIVEIQVPYSVQGDSKHLLKKVKLATHLVECKMNSEIPVLLDRAKEITSFKSFNSTFILSVPSSLMKRNCEMMIVVSELSTSKCRKTENFPAGSLISFRIACDTVNDSNDECSES